jgi:DNA-binding MarR family transcriptional regulator
MNPNLPPSNPSVSDPVSAEPDAPSLGMLITMVRSEIVRAIEKELASQGLDLSFTQYLILKKSQQLGAVSATELARAVELDGGAMTRQLDQLERKGYMRRSPHEQDRRALRIELTNAGSTVWQNTASVCSQRVMDAAQSSMSKTEQAQLHDYLERVLRALRDKN